MEEMINCATGLSSRRTTGEKRHMRQRNSGRFGEDEAALGMCHSLMRRKDTRRPCLLVLDNNSRLGIEDYAMVIGPTGEVEQVIQRTRNGVR